MRVLLIGSGGREHALALGLSKDPAVTKLFAAPGNPGIAEVAELMPVDPLDPAAVTQLARQTKADLVVIGPEAPLVKGVADPLRDNGIAVFGPSKAAARIEGSKDFAKKVMAAANVPTARSFTCTTREEIELALATFGAPYVVKDDGLAAGKGVVVTDDFAKALEHGLACDRVVIEEYLDGPEVSLLVVCDGETAVPLLPAQDFKRINDGDEGPNTGGMGSYSPLPWAPANLVETVMTQVVQPTLKQMKADGNPFQGVLFVGLAMTKAGAKVIEFNARFGDPETQSVLALLKTPLAELLYAAASGALKTFPPLRWRDGSAVSVVISTKGYPESPRSGDVITGADGLFHAGTKLENGVLQTAGGRVLCATATGRNLTEARAAAYELAGNVNIDGSHYRKDIALIAAAAE